ncbi:MAG TPA: DNA polymerase/3'-5' exonuclease PolX [Gaiellaceae bacterium]|nr:DNA polymerase/3'-5' exonuclease PolX [Gaiellaceae bacterium]
MLPRNGDLADQFDLLADLLELDGADYFRINAYRKAATRIRETAGPVARLALEGRAKELGGIGKTIEEKIVQVVELGEIEALTRRKQKVPEELVRFLRLPGLGPKTVRRIWQELDIVTLDGLREAAEAGRLRELQGLGPKSEEKILAALRAEPEPEGPKRRLLGTSLPALEAVVSALAEHPAAEKVSVAGSARRMRETVRDLDIIATASEPQALVDHFTSLAWVAEVVAKGSTKATVVAHDGLRFDLRVVPPECFGNLLQHFTGSKQHNVALREDAVRRKLSISEYGVTEVEGGEVHTFATEQELYAFLGYAYIPPELREGSGELAAARAGALPELVEVGELRGDLHTHTTWSADGKSTLAEMVAAAEARGYDYYAVTDHSHYLREGRLEAQWEEIEALQERVGLRILRGVEVNIRADGTLDMPDEELARLDWVVASVHAARETRTTERIVAAMENPHVDCIGHLTGRKLGQRAGAEVDFGQIVVKALETGTLLEINSQPNRLDLSDVHARAAREAGLKLVVSTDAHEAASLEFARFGIGVARRAWCTRDDVANTLSWPELDALRRRSRGDAAAGDGA